MKKNMSIIKYAFCAIALFAIHCADVEYNNPADPDGTSAPYTPTDVTAAVDTSSYTYSRLIKVKWTNAPGARGYYIYRSTEYNGYYRQIGSYWDSWNPSYEDYTGLLAGTTYYYRVVAYNNAGISGQSDYAYATTLPDIPANVTAAAISPSSIKVSWLSVPGVDGYYIYRGYNNILVGISDTPSYIDTELMANTEYSYRVAAYIGAVKGKKSDEVYAVTMLNVPNAPTDVRATATTANSINHITVRWSSVSNADEYRVYRSTNPTGGDYLHIGTQPQHLSLSQSEYNDYSVSAGITYYYYVVACNSTGESALSNIAIVTTAPGIPMDVKATVNSSNSITVSWSPVAGADGYYIYRNMPSSSDYYYNVGNVSMTSYTDDAVSNRTRYDYYVVAYNNAGTGNKSITVSAMVGSE